jgi:hypothetical protein
MTTNRILNIGQMLERAEQFPRVNLTIRSQPLPKGAGDPTNESDSCDGIMLSVALHGSDVRGFITKLAEEQGIGIETPSGVLVWLPWPFASITLQRVQ